MRVFITLLTLLEAVCVALWLGSGYALALHILAGWIVFSFCLSTLMFFIFVLNPKKIEGLSEFSKIYVITGYAWAILLIIALVYGNEYTLAALVVLAAIRDITTRTIYKRKFGSSFK